MTETVFFSWQADTPSQVGRNFIKEILEDVCAAVAADTSVDEAMRNLAVDSDTQNVAGQPPVMDTIFRKIDAAAVFVADLTFVGKALDGSPIPNPNVLIESGWALKSMRYERTIYLMNTFYGEPTRENLPFDLSHLRWPIRYNLSPDATPDVKKNVRQELIKEIGKAIRLSLAAVPSPQEGIIAEWMDPDWFKLGGGSYSNLVPTHVDLWLQVYFRNTTNDPQTLQSARAEFARGGRFWQGSYLGMQPTFNGSVAQSFQLVPKSILPKDNIPFYFHFDFATAGRSPSDFIAQLKESPDLTFKIVYETKEGAQTTPKSIERNLIFREEYKKIYKGFLSGIQNPQAPALIQLLDS